MWDVQLHILTVYFSSRRRLISTHKLALWARNIDRTNMSSFGFYSVHILINILYTFSQILCMGGEWDIFLKITIVTN